MKKVYKDTTEELPTNAPIPLGTPIQVNCFVESDQAGDRLTRRSQSGILLFCNSAPIYWYSQKQNMFEASTYGAELVALSLEAELVASLCYKLRMFGIPVDGTSNILCDNESVYRNVSFADSILKKKHNSICYHFVREKVATGTIIIQKVDGGENLSDILTKAVLPNTRKYLRGRIMFQEG